MIAPAYYMYVYKHHVYSVQSMDMEREKCCEPEGIVNQSCRQLLKSWGLTASEEDSLKLQSGLGDSGNRPALFQGDPSHTM